MGSFRGSVSRFFNENHGGPVSFVRLSVADITSYMTSWKCWRLDPILAIVWNGFETKGVKMHASSKIFWKLWSFGSVIDPPMFACIQVLMFSRLFRHAGSGSPREEAVEGLLSWRHRRDHLARGHSRVFSFGGVWWRYSWLHGSGSRVKTGNRRAWAASLGFLKFCAAIHNIYIYTLEVQPPFFMSGFRTTILLVGVYHLPKGTTILKMMVDFQGIYVYMYRGG